MPEDFIVSTKFVGKDQMSMVWDKQKRQANQFGKTAVRNFDRASRSAGHFGDVVGGIVGAGLISRAFEEAKVHAAGFVTEAAKVETTEVFFKRFVGGLENAKNVVFEMRQLAAETPLLFENLIPSTRLLLGFEAVNRQNLIPTLRMLGDLVGGNSERLERAAFAFGEVQAAGRATMQEMRQFINAGIPVLKQLERQWGKTNVEVRKMIEMGKATGPEILKALKTMTSEGGRFFGAMEDAAQTLEGRWSTFLDNIKLAKAEIGAKLLPVLKGYVNSGIEMTRTVVDWANANQGLIREEVNLWLSTGRDVLKELWPVAKVMLGIVSDMLPVIRALAPALPVLVAGWAANKIVMKGILALKFGQNLLVMTGLVKAATAAQWGWNVSMTANPIGLIITGIAALVGGIVLVVKHWDFLEAKIISGSASILTAFKEDFFDTLRVATWVFRMIARGAFEFTRRMGQIFGYKGVEAEFGRMVTVMDELDEQLRKAAGIDNPWDAQVMADAIVGLTRIGKLTVAPPIITLTPDQYKIEDLPAVTQAIKLDVNRLNVERAFPLMPPPALGGRSGVAPPNVNIPAPFWFDAPFSGDRAAVPQRTERKKTIEHVVRLDIAGAPEGTKVTIGKSKAQAPPLTVNLLK